VVRDQLAMITEQRDELQQALDNLSKQHAELLDKWMKEVVNKH